MANGHHWDPRWPEPPFPGEFAGEQMHAHHYKTPDGLEGKNVLVLGIGNSAMDIACETSRVSNMTFLAARRGAWILPKYVGSTPTDELGGARWPRGCRSRVLRAMYHRRVVKQQGRPQDYGLPEPDHKLGEAHPTISSEILPRIGHGRVTPKPNIERLEGEQRPLRRRVCRGRRHDHLLHGLQDQLPVPGAARCSIPRTTWCRSTGASCTRTAPASGSSG